MYDDVAQLVRALKNRNRLLYFLKNKTNKQKQ